MAIDLNLSYDEGDGDAIPDLNEALPVGEEVGSHRVQDQTDEQQQHIHAGQCDFSET
uniref:Uncharacterized protein n=1 Tax=Oryza punctata TaxID=4537 RepID=A0A0E0KE79_ORYPU